MRNIEMKNNNYYEPMDVRAVFTNKINIAGLTKNIEDAIREEFDDMIMEYLDSALCDDFDNDYDYTIPEEDFEKVKAWVYAHIDINLYNFLKDVEAELVLDGKENNGIEENGDNENE